MKMKCEKYLIILLFLILMGCYIPAEKVSKFSEICRNHGGFKNYDAFNDNIYCNDGKFFTTWGGEYVQWN